MITNGKEMLNDSVSRFEKEGFTIVSWSFERNITTGDAKLIIDYIDNFGDREGWEAHLDDSYSEEDKERIRKYKGKRK